RVPRKRRRLLGGGGGVWTTWQWHGPETGSGGRGPRLSYDCRETEEPGASLEILEVPVVLEVQEPRSRLPVDNSTGSSPKSTKAGNRHSPSGSTRRTPSRAAASRARRRRCRRMESAA